MLIFLSQFVSEQCHCNSPAHIVSKSINSRLTPVIMCWIPNWKHRFELIRYLFLVSSNDTSWTLCLLIICYFRLDCHCFCHLTIHNYWISLVKANMLASRNLIHFATCLRLIQQSIMRFCEMSNKLPFDTPAFTTRINLLQKYWKNVKSATGLHSNPNYSVLAEVLKKCKRRDWMAFKSELLNCFRTNSYAIFSIVFASLFYIVMSKPMTYFSDKARRKKLL